VGPWAGTVGRCAPLAEQKIREFSSTTADEARLKMAEVPDGARLWFGGSLIFPALQVENIYILPASPSCSATSSRGSRTGLRAILSICG